MGARVWEPADGRPPQRPRLGLAGQVGRRAHGAGARASSGRGLIMLGRAGPRAEGAAQARHEAHAGPAQVRLISCRARPKKFCFEPAHGLHAKWKTIPTCDLGPTANKETGDNVRKISDLLGDEKRG